MSGPYILLLIVVAFILLLGYKSIKLSSQDADQIQITLLQNQLKNDVQLISFGDTKINTYRLPRGVNKVCFSEPKNTNPLLCQGCQQADELPILADAVRDNANNNVFFLGDNLPDTTRIDGLTIGCCEFFCTNVSNGKVKLKLQGQSRNTLISEP